MDTTENWLARPEPRTNGRGPTPWQGPSRSMSGANHDDRQSTVSPAEVEAAVRSATFARLFATADPDDDLLTLIAGGKHGWHRCPTCRWRAVEVTDSVRAYCAHCRRRWTRWALQQHLLADAAAVERIAEAIAARRR